MKSRTFHTVWREHALRAAAGLGLLLPVGCTSTSHDTPDSAAAGRDSGARADAGKAASDAGSAASDAHNAPRDAGSDAPTFSCVGDAAKSDTVKVPAGSYIIGCNAAVDTDCSSDELPMHTVTLSAFTIERTEVTQGQYATCVTAGACGPPACAWDCSKTGYPAACVMWNQAKGYCSWAGRRLPTEAEWEAAARGPTGLKYPWGGQDPDCLLTNMSGCSGHTDPVGSHPTGASPFGALDMAGNVVEMVADWYNATYYEVSPTVDPTGPATGTTYGGRGGGYASDSVWQRTSSRDWYDPTDAFSALGFRCAD